MPKNNIRCLLTNCLRNRSTKDFYFVVKKDYITKSSSSMVQCFRKFNAFDWDKIKGHKICEKSAEQKMVDLSYNLNY